MKHRTSVASPARAQFADGRSIEVKIPIDAYLSIESSAIKHERPVDEEAATWLISTAAQNRDAEENPVHQIEQLLRQLQKCCHHILYPPEIVKQYSVLKPLKKGDNGVC